MKYRTIVADPPWQYNATVGRSFKPSVPESHYPTMSNAEIASLPVEEWADDNAHLYLWVTNPRLYGERRSRETQPIDIMEAWGFRYVTLLTWHKLGSPGIGFHFRGSTEHVLFGVRGKVTIPTAIRQPTLFAAPKRSHSEKPDRFYELVELVSPEPRLELFARRRRYGWDVWGDEAPTTAASQAEMGFDVMEYMADEQRRVALESDPDGLMEDSRLYARLEAAETTLDDVEAARELISKAKHGTQTTGRFGSSASEGDIA